MNRRHASAAVILGSAVVLFATACGSSDSGSDSSKSGASSGSSASSSSSSAAGGSGAASHDPGTSTGTSTQAGSTGGGAPAGSSTASGGASGRKPCHLPSGYEHFFKFGSAETYQGNTVVRVTQETCTVNPKNDEDVEYTPVEAARSFTVGSGASVKILSGTGAPDTVKPHWLVKHKLVNSPYFYYRTNSQNEISAMQEIYHP